jgi:hypothetical protein
MDPDRAEAGIDPTIQGGGPEFRDGDLLFRAGTADDSRLIMQLTGGQFSHAGICGRAETGEAVDAYPRDPQDQAIACVSLVEFFDEHHAAGGGGVCRYRGDPERAREAARFAARQVDERYFFDIRSPILGRGYEVVGDNRLYCSEFVWHCFRTGAGVTLVDPRDFYDLFTAAGRAEDAESLAALVRERLVSARTPKQMAQKATAQVMSDPALARKVLKRELGPGHNGRFVTPDQLARSPRVLHVHTFPARSPEGQS